MNHVSLSELFNGILDSFDEIYSPSTKAEEIQARREELIARVKESEKGDSYGYHMKTTKLIDILVPFMDEGGAVSRAELTNLFLSLLDLTRPELEQRTRTKLTKNRLEPHFQSIVRAEGFLAIDSEDSRDKKHPPYSKAVGEWEVTFGYFPEYVPHHNLYGSRGIAPQAGSEISLSARYLGETYRPDYGRESPGPDLLGFLKSPEAAQLARMYGIRYQPGKPDRSFRTPDRIARGDYDAIIKDLEKELENTPYSAEKRIKEISSIDVFHEDEGLSIHLMARAVPKDSFRDTTSMRQTIALVVGGDFSRVTEPRWEEFKKATLVALKGLETLKTHPWV